MGQPLNEVDTPLCKIGVPICAYNYLDALPIGHTRACMGAGFIGTFNQFSSEQVMTTLNRPHRLELGTDIGAALERKSHRFDWLPCTLSV